MVSIRMRGTMTAKKQAVITVFLVRLVDNDGRVCIDTQTILGAAQEHSAERYQDGDFREVEVVQRIEFDASSGLLMVALALDKLNKTHHTLDLVDSVAQSVASALVSCS